MNKRGIKQKGLFSKTVNGTNMRQRIFYNTHNNHVRIGALTIEKSKGWRSGIINNKNCADYLGVTIAEQLLAQVFKNVDRMPIHNRGFDFKCNQGYMIDVKSATKVKNRNSWMFNIKRNSIADYFLCMSFDNRIDLNPLHIWLIPSEKVNHLITLMISQSTIDKWSKFELSDKMDKVISCCNIMKGDN